MIPTPADHDRTTKVDPFLPMRLYAVAMLAVMLLATGLTLADPARHGAADLAVLLTAAAIEVSAAVYLLVKPWRVAVAA